MRGLIWVTRSWEMGTLPLVKGPILQKRVERDLSPGQRIVATIGQLLPTMVPTASNEPSWGPMCITRVLNWCYIAASLHVPPLSPNDDPSLAQSHSGSTGDARPRFEAKAQDCLSNPCHPFTR